jgi:hypothetical protein
MSLSRRGFLSVFGSMAAAAVALPLLDLDKLLWVPGEKKIVLPSIHQELRVGDVFTIEGVYAVNPSKRLQRFIVTTHGSSGVVCMEPYHPKRLKVIASLTGTPAMAFRAQA